MHPFPEKPLEYESPNPTESYTNLVVPLKETSDHQNAFSHSIFSNGRHVCPWPLN